MWTFPRPTGRLHDESCRESYCQGHLALVRKPPQPLEALPVSVHSAVSAPLLEKAHLEQRIELVSFLLRSKVLFAGCSSTGTYPNAPGGPEGRLGSPVRSAAILCDPGGYSEKGNGKGRPALEPRQPPPVQPERGQQTITATTPTPTRAGPTASAPMRAHPRRYPRPARRARARSEPARGRRS
jgi:hypothetical protein